MKFLYTKVKLSDLKNSWCPRYLYIQQKIDRGEPIEEDDITPKLALGYVSIHLKRVPELEHIIIHSSPDIRSDYLKLLKLIKESKTENS